MQVVSSSLTFREDMDIGSVFVGDLHQKSKSVQMRVAEVQDLLIHFRRTQLHLFYAGLGLEEPTDDIASDVDSVRLLLGEFPVVDVARRSPTTLGFVADVQEALSLDTLDGLPMPSQNTLEGLDVISTQDLGMSQLNVGQSSPPSLVSPAPPPPLTPHGLLCRMHANNPCPPTSIRDGPGQGPWFSRTPSLTRPRVLKFKDHVPIQSSKDINVCGTEAPQHSGMATDSEAASEVLQHPRIPRDKSPVRPTTRDVSFDNVLGKTTHKSDGRYGFLIVFYCHSRYYCYILMRFEGLTLTIMSCRLEQLVDTICTQAGAPMVRYFDFLYRGDYLNLSWAGDVLPLTQFYGEMSNHLMDWIRAWLNPQLEDINCYVCSPYLIGLLTSHVRGARSIGLELYTEFIRDKCRSLPTLDGTTLIVPYTCGKHWSVYAVGEAGFFHFDSLHGLGLHSDATIRTSLAKLWAARTTCSEYSDRWLEAQSPHAWIQPSVPQQNSGWACGFYVLKNIMEFAMAMRHRPHSLGEVSDELKQLGLSKSRMRT